MSASINNKIFIPVNFLWMSINLLLINFIDSIEIIINNIELCCSIYDWSMHYFSEGKIKCTYLPTGTACEKLIRFFMGSSDQRHTFLTISRYGEVWEFFKKSLFSFFQGCFVLTSFHFLLNGSVNRFTDFINSFFLIVLPKVKDFIGLYNTVFE